MTSLDSLYELAEDEEIEIYAFDLPLTGPSPLWSRTALVISESILFQSTPAPKRRFVWLTNSVTA